MTVRTNARIAGVTLLIYIAAGMSMMALAGNTPAIAVLSLVTSFSALLLGVTLYHNHARPGSRPGDGGPDLSRH